jgi:hypothetical protein
MDGVAMPGGLAADVIPALPAVRLVADRRAGQWHFLGIAGIARPGLTISLAGPGYHAEEIHALL